MGEDEECEEYEGKLECQGEERVWAECGAALPWCLQAAQLHSGDWFSGTLWE